MIKASSLYETVLSIAIISVVITVATLIFFNVTNSFGSMGQQQVWNQMDSLRYETIDNQDFSNKKVSFKEFEIQKEVEDFENKDELKKVTFSVLRDSIEVEKAQFIVRKN